MIPPALLLLLAAAAHATESADTVDAAIASVSPTVQACYREALAEDPEAFGSVALRFKAPPRATEGELTLSRSNLRSLPFDACVARALPATYPLDPAPQTELDASRPLVLLPDRWTPRKAPVDAILACLEPDDFAQVRVRLERGWPRAVAIKTRGILETPKRSCVERAVIDRARTGRKTRTYYLTSADPSR